MEGLSSKRDPGSSRVPNSGSRAILISKKLLEMVNFKYTPEISDVMTARSKSVTAQAMDLC